LKPFWEVKGSFLVLTGLKRRKEMKKGGTKKTAHKFWATFLQGNLRTFNLHKEANIDFQYSHMTSNDRFVSTFQKLKK
jgi:hypothetical protein